jgi:hypothetical protein
MVERVAKALHEIPGMGYDWDDADEGERRHAREYARAAIEAMREPTFDPETVSYHQGMSRRDWWGAMISQALNEEG